MGDCLIVRRGGAVFKLPGLSPVLPADLTVKRGVLLNARFSVEIQTPGVPSQYTYQWYLDNSSIPGATGVSCIINQGAAEGRHFVYCKVTNEAGTVKSRSAILTVSSYLPKYYYTGLNQIIDEGNFNWKLKLLSTGTLLLNEDIGKVDVFLSGGGGGGGFDQGGGGGGGYTKTVKGVAIQVASPYPIVVGGGGVKGTGDTVGGTGGASSAFGTTANGGIGGETFTRQNASSQTNDNSYREGGAGGSAGGYGGDNGNTAGCSDGASGNFGAKGQGTTTREFADPGGALYAGGGGGGRTDGKSKPGGAGGGGTGASTNATNGGINTGGGGGGAGVRGTPGAGGSGIVIIRNHRG